MESSDAELLERIRAGQIDAFTLLVDRYRDVVCAIAFHYLKNRDDAQDAAQETFIHAYLHLSELRETPRFGPWLRRIAVNRCLDTLRRRARESPAICSSNFAGFAAEDMTETLSRRLLVRQALDRLSEKVRLTVTLCYFADYSHAEIAQFLQIPITTVRSRLRHAKQLFREEKLTMTSELFPPLQAGPDWTRQVVEEAIRRGKEAIARHERGEAIAAFDTALTELENAGSDPEAKRLILAVLRDKESSSPHTAGNDERSALLEQALLLARELGDPIAEAEILQDKGRIERVPEHKAAHYAAALALFRQHGSVLRQAECLLYLGATALFQDDAAGAETFLAEALPLFRASQSRDWEAVCLALREMREATRSVGLKSLLLWVGMCDVLEKHGGAVSLAAQPGFQVTRRSEDVPDSLFLGSAFWQLSALKPFLDTEVTVGGSWSGNVFSFSNQPLRAEMTVVSMSESVTVPAGCFSGCLLTEMVTISPHLTEDEAPERQHQLNRMFLCGRRRAWYAPGVGLVQIDVETEEGTTAQIALESYSVPTSGREYLPLAVGHAWTYSRPDTSMEYESVETYRVTAQSGDRWHLSHSAFVYQKTP